jgi:xylan 1,4-beta-xylosidase
MIFHRLKYIMRTTLNSILLFFCVSSFSQLWYNPIRVSDEWTNYSIGDPYVFKYNGLFYLYCSTRDDQSGVKVWSTKDLVTWKYEGLCTTDPITKGAYAPEVIQYGGDFYMYTSPAGKGHYVLKSSSPTGPFTIVTTNLGMSIDGSVFKDDDGSIYFYHSGNNGIVGRRMNTPTTFGSAVILTATGMRGWTEGPSLIKRNGVYYMSYTGNHVISKGYRVDFASSKLGPLSGFISDNNQNPVVLRTEGGHVGLGHGTLFRGPNLDEYFTTYHNLGSSFSTGPQRFLNIDRVSFSGERMMFHAPNNTPQQKPLLPVFADYFDATHNASQWDFEGGSQWSVSDGALNFVKNDALDESFRGALVEIIPDSNYIAEFNVAEASATDPLIAGALFNYIDNNNYGRVVFDKAGNKLHVRFLNKGIWSEEWQSTLTGVSKYAVFHFIRIEKENDVFRFFVDDMLKLTLNQSVQPGKIGYISLSSKARFGFCAFSNQFNGSSIFEIEKPIPGKIAAVQYVKGGNGIGHQTANTSKNSYRHDEVLLINSQLGGLAVKASAGEWFKYNVMVRVSRLHNVTIGCKPGSNGCKINLYEGNELLTQNVILPANNGLYRAFIIDSVYLTSGAQQLKLEVVEGEAEFTEFGFSHFTFVEDRTELFNDSHSLGWKYADGNWSVSDGTLRGSDYGKGLLGDDGWTDFSVLADVKYTSGMNGGIVFRAINPALGGPNDNPQLGADFFQGYFVTLESSRVVLGKHNYNYQFLQQKSGSYKINTWYKLAITVKGNNIKVFVDDMLNPVIDYIDNTPFVSGKVGFRVFNSNVEFDNFKVTTKPLSTALDLTKYNSVKKYSVFPNPSSGKFTFQSGFENADTISFSLFSINGSFIKSGTVIMNGDINIQDIGKGVYFIEFKGLKGKNIEKIMVY